MLIKALPAILLLLTAPLFAAEPAGPPVPPEETAETAENPQVVGPAAGGDQEEAAGDTEPAGETEGGEGEDSAAVTIDDTFIPSTQISEDLSVSFPIDI